LDVCRFRSCFECDIESLGTSVLQTDIGEESIGSELQWVYDFFPYYKTIFCTGHAGFFRR
jgi:hypothetical protein